MTAYSQPGDRWTAYEIDPAIARIARDTSLFTFVATSPAPVEIVLGDARLSLAASHRRFDVLLIDAYSSDAIPLHLLTREALQVYLAHLAPGGIIALHLSNRFFDLAPIVSRLAGDAGLACRVRSHDVPAVDDIRARVFPSLYAVVARDARDLADLPASVGWRAGVPHPGTPLWTDDFASPLSALRHR
jgi:hypothetical protein